MTFHVSLQVVGGDKTFSTDPAPVGFFSSVNPLVNCEVGGVSEGLLTLGTNIRLSLLVLLGVDPQAPTIGETFLAGIALVRLISRVDVLVFLQ